VTDKFTFVDGGPVNFTALGAQQKGFVYLILNPAGHQKNVGIINVHLKGGVSLEEKDYMSKQEKSRLYNKFRTDQLNEIAQFIKRYENQGVKKWIVAGDFNWAWTQGNTADQWIKSNGFNMISTQNFLYNNSFAQKGWAPNEKKDFILYKGLKLLNFTTGPQLNQLLTHSPVDRTKPHYSDHFELMATFAFGAWNKDYDSALQFLRKKDQNTFYKLVQLRNLDMNLKNPKIGKSLLDVINTKASDEVDARGDIDGPWYKLMDKYGE